MTQDTWTDRLSEYVDGELETSERVVLEAHLDGCADCRANVELLRAVQARARRLTDRAPERDLWPAIAAMIGPETPVRPAATQVRPLVPRRRYAFSVPQLAAAGIVLALLSGGAVRLLDRDAAPVAATAQPGADSLVVSAAATRADRTYDAAVADLQAVLDAGRSRLDAKTIAVLEANLALIDSAVSEAQRALTADPANAYLNSHLARTMRRKVDLLRQAATLVTAQS